MCIRVFMLGAAAAVGLSATVSDSPALAQPFDSSTVAQRTCVSFTDHGSYWTITNHCNRTIYVRWQDQGHCDSGCGTTISEGVEQPITEPSGRYIWTVRYTEGLIPF
jgi:hypothetical protein